MMPDNRVPERAKVSEWVLAVQREPMASTPSASKKRKPAKSSKKRWMSARYAEPIEVANSELPSYKREIQDLLDASLHERPWGCIHGRESSDRDLMRDAAVGGAQSIGVLQAKLLQQILISKVRAYGYGEEDDFGQVGDDLACALDTLNAHYRLSHKYGAPLFEDERTVPIETIRAQMVRVQESMQAIRRNLAAHTERPVHLGIGKVSEG